MIFYKIELKSGSSYIVKSEKTNMELLSLLFKNDWFDFLLAVPNVVYAGHERIENNVVMIKTSEVASLEYYIANAGNM